MAFDLNDDGVMLIRLRHVEAKPDGSFQYRRRIPKSLASHFPGKLFFVRSLGSDRSSLHEKCYAVAKKLEAEWIGLGWLKNDCPGVLAYVAPDLAINQSKPQPTQEVLRLSSALDLYLTLHPNAHRKAFSADCDRVVQRIIDLVGDFPINVYTREHAEIVRDSLAKTGSTSTVRRRLTTIVAIINKARKEKQLQMLNPFEGLGIVGEGEDGTKRIPFTNAELKIVSTACRNLNDEIRHIVAFLIDTGCRVSEVVGLRIEDVILEGPIPYVRIRPFGKVRTLKTPASERDIPLVGDALWAAEQALEARRKAKEAGSWVFPRYASDKEIKATHASATLNKWLRSLEGVSDQKTCHCARHAMRDRLRAAQVPVEIQDCLGGWGSRTIGQGYGNGYPLNILTKYMQVIVLNAAPL